MEKLAAAATYVLSAEHKDFYTPAGPPRLRSDATPCPRDITREQAEGWLRKALAAGAVGPVWADQPYPQLAWWKEGDLVFEARLSNAEAGWYHGYPLDRTEWPSWIN